MCIDESKEFEAINKKTGERNFIAETEGQCKEEYHRVKKAKAKKKAAVRMGATLGVLVIAMMGITALELIGWINDSFCIVLQCLAGCLAMFKTGYFWHEIKN